MNAHLDHAWSCIQGQLASAVDESTYRVWLEPLTARELAGESLLVEAPPRTFEWVHERFGRLLQTCTAATLGPHVTVEVVRGDAHPDAGSEHRPGRPRLGSQRLHRQRERGLTHRQAPRGRPEQEPPTHPTANPRLTFEHFVIGDSNRLAHAAVLAVAELPGHAYNPLFICGPPGVGKTHLLRSIAHMMLAHNPSLSVCTSTGEAFTSEFQLALGAERMDAFKARFRHVDVLLIDDVQFLERKTRTEEEFFHTFDTLYEAGAQLVLTSDRPPRNLQALEDRLRERFEAGLVADIRPPDFNTRLAILRKRIQHDGLHTIDPPVLDVIARRVTLNVRALEGALVRTVAFSSLTGQPPSPGLAVKVLDDLHSPESPVPQSLDTIKAAVCLRFKLTPDELLSPSRQARVAWPRQVAMYLARELTSESLPAIGRYFGGRDHTTVLHAWRRATAKIDADSSSHQVVDDLRKQLTGAHT